MKKISIALFAVTVLMFSGCTSDIEKYTKLLVGTWKIDKITGDYVPTGTSKKFTVDQNNTPSGTIVLNDLDGVLTGTISLRFTISDPTATWYECKGPITWSNDVSSITTTNGTEGPVTWIVGTNTETKQTWTYGGAAYALKDADGAMNIKSLELSKQ